MDAVSIALPLPSHLSPSARTSGHQHHNAEKTVDHRRNARQQLHRRLEHAIQLLGAEERQINRRQQRQPARPAAARPPSRRRCPQSSEKCRRYPRRASTSCRKGSSARRFPPSRAGRWQTGTMQISATHSTDTHAAARKTIFHHALQQAPVFCSFAPYHHPQKKFHCRAIPLRE